MPDSSPVETPGDAQVRREYLAHESLVRSFGSMICINAGSVIVWSGLAMFDILPGGVVLGVLLVLLAAGMLAWGLALRELRSWARIMFSAVATMWLFVFPVGTALGAWVLHSLHSVRGKMVFSPEYQRVRAATPEVNCPESILTWIYLGLIGLSTLAAVFGPLVKEMFGAIWDALR